jgi:hypothetical protein
VPSSLRSAPAPPLPVRARETRSRTRSAHPGPRRLGRLDDNPDGARRAGADRLQHRDPSHACRRGRSPRHRGGRVWPRR